MTPGSGEETDKAPEPPSHKVLGDVSAVVDPAGVNASDLVVIGPFTTSTLALAFSLVQEPKEAVTS